MLRFFHTLIELPAGRRAKLVVLVAGVMLAGAAASQAPKLGGAERSGAAAALPDGAESLRVVEAQARFPSSRLSPAVSVFRRESPLTRADHSSLERDRSRLNRSRTSAMGLTSAPRYSRDGKAALLLTSVREAGSGDASIRAVKRIRTIVGREKHRGLAVAVTGAAAFEADVDSAFAGANGTLLLGTALLVLVLLVIIYRSPIFWLLPLLTVVLAEAATEGIGYWLTRAGLTIDPPTAGITSVLVFGAGTDYALLLVARYREELRRYEDKHEAMKRALTSAGPAIFASGITVALSLLVLLLASIQSTRALGPLAAVGVTCAMLAMLTILPALLLVAGRRAFWPRVPIVAAHRDPTVHGFWRRLGGRVARRHRPVGLIVALTLLVLCLGLGRLQSTLSPTDQFRTRVEAIEGQRLLAERFSAGSSATTDILIPAADGARARRIAARLAERRDLVAGVSGIETGRLGALVRVVTADDPFATRAIDEIPKLRAAVRKAAGPRAAVGGPTAENYDTRQGARRDNRVVVPVTLAVVLLILIALLRSLVAPALLTATVIVSFGGTLGASALAFDHLFGYRGADPSLLLIGFVFLIALGVDYNIFLMTRVREETRAHGTQEGMLRGLAVTGTVITSAGIVLAGTFSILAMLPIVALTELGFVIALGVLLDTFLVRSILVPAVTFELGNRIWWPSRLARAHSPAESNAAEDANSGAETAETPVPNRLM